MNRAAFILLSSVATGASATVYYVGPTGDNGNSGLGPKQAFKTLQHAADLVTPGDSVAVKNGVYVNDNWTVVYVSRGGTAEAPVTFVSLNRQRAKIGDAFATRYAFAFAPDVSYVTVQGFDIQHVTGSGIIIGPTNTAITINDNLFHHIGLVCSDGINGHNGILVAGTGHRISGNRFRLIGRLGPGEKNCALKTSNYQNHDHAIYVNGASDLGITDNYFRSIARGWPVQIYNSNGIVTRNLIIRGNLFLGANPYRDGQIELGDPGLSDATISNNLFAYPRGAAVSISGQRFENVYIGNNMLQGESAISTPTAVDGVIIAE